MEEDFINIQDAKESNVYSCKHKKSCDSSEKNCLLIYKKYFAMIKQIIKRKGFYREKKNGKGT